MQIEGSTALVTGANRGLGRRFAEELLSRGAKVYGAARRPDSITVPGVIPVTLDVTDPASVAAAAAATGDVTLLINNAGSSTGARLFDGPLADIELEMNTHFFGTLAVTRAFAPQLAAGGGGAVLNVLSVLSWISLPDAGAYSAAKSAEWALTSPKLDPAVVARLALDGLAAGQPEVLADDLSRQVQQGLAGGVAALYPQVAAPPMSSGAGARG
jgi:NAD(P)-dependent dehydrogenase (short-subunit alcohol dehydrogenase family)